MESSCSEASTDATEDVLVKFGLCSLRRHASSDEADLSVSEVRSVSQKVTSITKSRPVAACISDSDDARKRKPSSACGPIVSPTRPTSSPRILRDASFRSDGPLLGTRVPLHMREKLPGNDRFQLRSRNVNQYRKGNENFRPRVSPGAVFRGRNSSRLKEGAPLYRELYPPLQNGPPRVVTRLALRPVYLHSATQGPRPRCVRGPGDEVRSRLEAMAHRGRAACGDPRERRVSLLEKSPQQRNTPPKLSDGVAGSSDSLARSSDTLAIAGEAPAKSGDTRSIGRHAIARLSDALATTSNDPARSNDSPSKPSDSLSGAKDAPDRSSDALTRPSDATSNSLGRARDSPTRPSDKPATPTQLVRVSGELRKPSNSPVRTSDEPVIASTALDASPNDALTVSRETLVGPSCESAKSNYSFQLDYYCAVM